MARTRKRERTNGNGAPAAAAVRALGGDRSFENRIRECYPDLPESERKVADLVIDFPGEIAAYSATELAELAGASKAAVTRLIRRLGYGNFDEARRSARDTRDWGSPLYLLRHEPAAPPVDQRLREHLEQDLGNIARTFDGLNPAQMDQIVEAVASARRVWLLGYRNSHILATYARWQFIQVRDEVHVLPLGGETLAEYLASMSGDDLMIAFGFRRRVAQVRRAMEIANRAGTPILYMADPTVRETAALARWTLLCEVGGVGVFDSYSAALSLLHYLCVALVAKTGAAGRRRLQRVEDMHDALGDFA